MSGGGPPARVRPETPLDLLAQSPFPDHTLQLSPRATPEDAASERRIKEADATSERELRVLRTRAAYAGFLVTVVACVAVVLGFVPSATPALAEKALTLLGALLTGVLAYAAGTKAGK